MTLLAQDKKPIKNYTVVVLDQSGSMGHYKKEAMDHFNEVVDVVKQSDGKVDTSLILTLFDSNVSINKWNVHVDNVQKLGDGDYTPNGMTALLDAIGLTVQRMLKELPDINDDNVAVVFNVVTDGMENHSVEFQGKQIKEMVEELEKTGRWTFTFAGAGSREDVFKRAAGLGFNRDSTLSYASSASGMAASSKRKRKGLLRTYLLFASGETNNRGFYSDSDD